MASIIFNVASDSHNNSTFNWAERRAAFRQTEEQRNRVFSKYQALVGTVFKNSMAARRAANKELNDRDKTPEYWDDDTAPRRSITPSSSAIKNIRTFAGGCFIQFKGNGPSREKWYWYPCAGTKEATAKRVGKMLTSNSIGKYYNSVFRGQNAMGTRITKAGNKEYVGKMLSYKPNKRR